MRTFSNYSEKELKNLLSELKELDMEYAQSLASLIGDELKRREDERKRKEEKELEAKKKVEKEMLSKVGKCFKSTSNFSRIFDGVYYKIVGIDEVDGKYYYILKIRGLYNWYNGYYIMSYAELVSRNDDEVGEKDI